MYNIIITDRITKEEMVLTTKNTEKSAESFCEAWGWFYTDENNKTFWLGYEEVTENETN